MNRSRFILHTPLVGPVRNNGLQLTARRGAADAERSAGGAEQKHHMAWLTSAVILLFTGSGSGQAAEDPILRPPCKGISVTLVADPSQVTVGVRPRFSVAVTNDTERPMRILDVRNGRRVDLQDTYFELFVVHGTRLVDVPIAISDPGPLSSTDFLELQPRARVEFRHISYTRMLEELPPESYEAFILFWRDPMESHTTRCRSGSARFTVHD